MAKVFVHVHKTKDSLKTDAVACASDLMSVALRIRTLKGSATNSEDKAYLQGAMEKIDQARKMLADVG